MTKKPTSIKLRMKELVESGKVHLYPENDERLINFDRQLEESKRRFKQDYQSSIDVKVGRELSKPKQLCLSGLPTDLCRTTIFHPLPRRGRKQLQSKPIKRLYETTWSKIVYEGRLLSVDDEDVLLAVLSFARELRCYEFVISYPEIQAKLGIEKPNSTYNKRIKEALERLSKASFSVEIKEEELWGVNHILKAKGYKRKILVTIDDDFYRNFLGSYTVLSLPFRMSLNGDLTKLLFTFLSSHKNPFGYSLETLNDVLNMGKDINDADQRKEAVRQLKIAFSELKKKGFLLSNSRSSFH